MRSPLKRSIANYKSKEYVGLSKKYENIVLRECMQIGGSTIIRLNKEKDQLIEEIKQIKELLRDKLDERIVK
jgi:hypothetical protein